MKIIGKSKRKVIIEAENDEIAHLFGFNSAWRNEDILQVGTDIKVDAAFQYVGWIYHHRDSFERLAKELRASADSIDKFPALFESLSIPKKP